MPEGAIPLIEGITSLGLSTKGTGADNIRNVTGSPTAGIDPQELLDTRPYARAWHHHILNDRSLYGLPRKFNVGFDGGGIIPVLEDTNDIAFTAVTVAEGAGVDAGVWFRLGIGGITGPPGLRQVLRASTSSRRTPWPWPTPSCASSSTTAIAPTARRRASSTCSTPGATTSSSPRSRPSSAGHSCALPADKVSAPNRQDRQAHVGIHAQKQAGQVWAGVVLPVGKLHELRADARARAHRRASSATAISASPSGRTS